MNFIINQLRDCRQGYTQSKVFIPGRISRFCWALEDQKQPYGEKVPGETCIPEGLLKEIAEKVLEYLKSVLEK